MVKKAAKATKGWRTLIVNLAFVVIGLIQFFHATEAIPKKWAGSVILLVSFANIYLRTITTTPIGKKS